VCLCVRKSSRKEEVTRTQKPFVATLRVNESRPAELGQQPEASLAWGGVTLTAKRQDRRKINPPTSHTLAHESGVWLRLSFVIGNKGPWPDSRITLASGSMQKDAPFCRQFWLADDIECAFSRPTFGVLKLPAPFADFSRRTLYESPRPAPVMHQNELDSYWRWPPLALIQVATSRWWPRFAEPS
jgi:hypothetical protein